MRPSRGAILLEVMLALGLFVVSAAFCLGVTRSLFAALDRADRRQLAVDLARSRLAELEAGMVNLQELRGEWAGGVGSHPDDVDIEATAPATSWEIEVTTSPGEYRGLSLIELTVTEVQPGADPGSDDRVRYTLRQLIALHEQDPEDYQVDEMLEGLEGNRR